MFHKFLNSFIAVIFLITSIVFAQDETGDPPPTGTATPSVDSKTGRVWQKCSLGQNNDATCSGTANTTTWTNAITYCNNLPSSGGKLWRLPHINELKALVDSTKASGATLNTTDFPATVSGNYWSSTTVATNSANGYVVSFSTGSVGNVAKTTPYYVRCISR